LQWFRDKAQLNKNDAAKAVEATFDIITGALKQGDEVKLVGFGSFTVSQRKAREGRNPRNRRAGPYRGFEGSEIHRRQGSERRREHGRGAGGQRRA